MGGKALKQFNIETERKSTKDFTSLTEKETEIDIINLCINAHKLNVKSVCVYPQFVKIAKEKLNSLNSNVLVCTVISFPKGSV